MAGEKRLRKERRKSPIFLLSPLFFLKNKKNYTTPRPLRKQARRMSDNRPSPGAVRAPLDLRGCPSMVRDGYPGGIRDVFAVTLGLTRLIPTVIIIDLIE